MLPINLVAAAVASFFPLALEIDYGATVPGGPADGKGYHLQVVISVAPAEKVLDFDVRTDFVGLPGELFLNSLNSELVRWGKWSFYRKGTALVIIGYKGSPVTKVKVTSNGPKPKVRWIPKPR